MTLMHVVEEAVTRLGVCTSSQVRAEVDRFISVSHAAAAGRRMRQAWKRQRLRENPDSQSAKPYSTLLEIGRNCIVNSALSSLYMQGRIRRLVKGVYAPKKG